MVEVVKELRRLLPGADAGLVLRNDPSWLLRWASPCGPPLCRVRTVRERVHAGARALHVRWAYAGMRLRK